MKRYILRANFDIGNIESREENGRIMVDVPMLSNGKLNYGLSHVKKYYIKKTYILQKLDLISCYLLQWSIWRIHELKERYMGKIHGREKSNLKYQCQT